MCLTKQEYCKKCEAVVEKRQVRTAYGYGFRCIICLINTQRKATEKLSDEQKKGRYLKNKLKQHESGKVKPRNLKPKVFDESGNLQCQHCNEFKPLPCFPKNKEGKNKGSICNKCRCPKTKAVIDIEEKRRKDRELLRQKRHNDELRLILNKRCNEYQAKLRPERQTQSLLKGLFSKVHWYNCKHCNSLKYIKRKHNEREVCNACKHIGRTFVVSPRVATCPKCNKSHIAKHINAMCDLCRKEAMKQHRKVAKDRRKAIQRKATIAESINQYKLLDRDKWRCCMCNCKVQKTNIYADNAAELDHIIPLSKGGVHTYSNVQTLCRRCNQAKTDKLVGQLVMCL
jgi:5-methylcytosine-specific restriction endonuclease McrA